MEETKREIETILETLPLEKVEYLDDNGNVKEI